jgi:SAM-dependent methyltransferase
MSSYDTEANLGDGASRHREGAVPTCSEAAYERMSRYRFAQRFTEGKIIAELTQEEESSYGSYLLAQSAHSVTALSGLPLPEESRFDVVVAFGVIENLERPEALMEEAKRVLKDGGTFIASTSDKRTNGGRGMYVPEFQGLLESHFGHVRLYRQGAVAGGFVSPASSEQLTDAAPVESVRLSEGGPRLGLEPPTSRSVMAVCSDVAEVLEGEERAYLLLDCERRVFDEYEERAEEVELMRAEIRRMEEAEVQAFVNAIQRQQRLPFAVLLRLIPQVLIYYLYDRSQKTSSKEIRHRLAIPIDEARHRRDTSLDEARHHLNAAIDEARHRRDVVLDEARHHWTIAIDEARHRRDIALELIFEESRQRRDTTLEETRRRRDVALEEIRRRRDMALDETRRRRDMALEEARRRRDATLEETRQRRDVALEEARRRRDMVFEVTRNHRNLALAEVRHRRNLILERIIHRRNIILGNVYVIRQKGARGLAKGALRRLRGGQKKS